LSTSDIPTPKTLTASKPITPAQQLLQKDVTRKEFMGVVALGLVSVMGFSSIIHFLTGHSGKSVASVTRGYGSGPYGG
jgi:hypothetical protein